HLDDRSKGFQEFHRRREAAAELDAEATKVSVESNHKGFNRIEPNSGGPLKKLRQLIRFINDEVHIKRTKILDALQVRRHTFEWQTCVVEEATSAPPSALKTHASRD